MMSDFSLITLLDQVFYTPEGNRKNINIVMNKSFSGLITNDFIKLDEIMKFEKSLKRNPNILEQLKSKKPYEDETLVLPEKHDFQDLPAKELGVDSDEEGENHDKFKNSIDKKKDEENEGSDSDESSGSSKKEEELMKKGKILLDHEQTYKLLSDNKQTFIGSFDELYLKEYEAPKQDGDDDSSSSSSLSYSSDVYEKEDKKRKKQDKEKLAKENKDRHPIRKLYKKEFVEAKSW
eukprot:CAMPEP_0170537680 /NCGR_PEP_ID=MMETSP0209-20121228/102861_1 /TAXON_ID=665100 ORGANISM="Litonotus pictus, Strain P1" /NCGR_SAMPLE_ID=MMETSP0209 /ASSEMBLY_ACC=CAM_ASM_000301 /LENGTH=234 /DNA_ID=CAMNT_0010839229 /DNA_START=404 /DNA_END=1105 /DNA_ORIENTATION=-